MAKKKDDPRKLIAENRRARFDYMIEETLEAGIQLVGTGVKPRRGAPPLFAESGSLRTSIARARLGSRRMKPRSSSAVIRR